MAGSMGSTRAETMVVGLAEKKDFLMGWHWHLDLKMVHSMNSTRAEKMVASLAETKDFLM